MTKKNIFLIFCVLALGGLSVYLNRDHFIGPPIQLSHRVMYNRRRGNRPDPNPMGETVRFLLDRPLRLTSITVIPLDTVETNKNPVPLWHLISDSSSRPTKEFSYGFRLEDMQPAVKGSMAQPLQPGVNYRIVVEAGRKKVQHDFSIPPPS